MGWLQQKVVPKVLDALNNDFNYKPTIRGMFYNLYSKGVIENTSTMYGSLTDALARARRNGTIPIDAFTDDSRHVDDLNDAYWTPQEYVNYLTNKLKDANSDYFDAGYIPRWYKQKHYVELLVEKDTLKPLFKDILSGREVRVTSNHGWSSMIHRQELCKRLQAKKSEGYRVHLLYAGDYDPTGQRMAKNVSLELYLALDMGMIGSELEQEISRVKKKGHEHVFNEYVNRAQSNEYFERIALTKQQIHDFDLWNTRNPDPNVMKKLNDDPNKEQFKAENNNELFQIEVDAMEKDPDRLQKLVLKAVDKYFNRHIYDTIKALPQHQPDYINRLVNEKVRFLD